MDTLSKVGVVLIAAGLSVLPGDGADWPGWLLVGFGIALAFGPDLARLYAPRARRRRELAERIPGWEAHIQDEGVGKLILTLTPPMDEKIDSTLSCEVQLPDGVAMPRHDVRTPGSSGVNGTWNDYYFIVFPDGFHDVNGTPLAPGEYTVMWTRFHGFGRQVLRRVSFTIDRRGTFSLK
jgi:hypothetical protein